MPDPVDAAIERLDTIRSHLTSFRRNNDLDWLESSLEEIEELHDDIENIIEDTR